MDLLKKRIKYSWHCINWDTKNKRTKCVKFDTFLLKFNFIVFKQRKNILVFFSYRSDPQQIAMFENWNLSKDRIESLSNILPAAVTTIIPRPHRAQQRSTTNFYWSLSISHQEIYEAWKSFANFIVKIAHQAEIIWWL